jgi:Domain of unknown function (DUF6249)
MDMMIFTLFWVFGWVILLLVAWHLRSSRRERQLEQQHKERMMAMEKGIPLPELPAEDDAPARRPLLAEIVAAIRINPRWPLGLGAVFVMFGIGLSAALALSQEPEHYRVWSFGLIPVFFGLGLMLHYALTRPGMPR